MSENAPSFVPSISNADISSLPDGLTPDPALANVAFEDMVKDNTVWRLRNPQTGEGFYIKRTTADEITMTTRAANFTLPADSPIILPQIAGTLEDLPPAIRSHLQSLPIRASDAERGATNFLITREVPFDAGIIHPYIALHRDVVINDIADASLAALKGKPITAAEYDRLVEGVTRLNEAGIFHGDMLSNISIQRGADGGMQFHIIDFDPWDPNIGKNALLDVDHIKRARADLESVGAVETSTRTTEPTRFELYKQGLLGKTTPYSLPAGEGLAAALSNAKKIATETGSVIALDLSAAGFSNTSPVRVSSQSNLPRLYSDLLAREGWQVNADGHQVRLPISNVALAQDTLQSMTLQGPEIRIETIEGQPYFISTDPAFVAVVQEFQATQKTNLQFAKENAERYEPYRTGPLSTAQVPTTDAPNIAIITNDTKKQGGLLSGITGGAVGGAGIGLGILGLMSKAGDDLNNSLVADVRDAMGSSFSADATAVVLDAGGMAVEHGASQVAANATKSAAANGASRAAVAAKAAQAARVGRIATGAGVLTGGLAVGLSSYAEAQYAEALETQAMHTDDAGERKDLAEEAAAAEGRSTWGLWAGLGAVVAGAAVVITAPVSVPVLIGVGVGSAAVGIGGAMAGDYVAREHEKETGDKLTEIDARRNAITPTSGSVISSAPTPPSTDPSAIREASLQFDGPPLPATEDTSSFIGSVSSPIRESGAHAIG